MMCGMKLDRRTVNFSPGEASFLDRYKDEDTPEHRALLSVLPEASTESDSAVIKALLHVAHRRIQDEAIGAAYDRAVEAGEFDAESRAAMRRSRKAVGSMVAEER